MRLWSHDGFLYVTNLALDLRLFRITAAADSQRAAQVTRYRVSKPRYASRP